ncbi:unnamed protein product [Bursaphelenchus xylophilus]|uniref:(pine wood nematode) hypothetical protein n=1 Tax=Bursaphelenchus xylophilus TaxID=6326 RepID=A0A7I8X9P0_BURXY|nr:unnamed protein product [Bursaphelenchus xylophilus]CAG9131909.1 unnamed protein product [Bursaphelenchus xylophilus]
MKIEKEVEKFVDAQLLGSYFLVDPVESDEILRTEDDTSDFEDQIEASLNVELGFSDDQENPSEEAEEPSSSLENDVNKLTRNQPKDTASPEHPMVPVRQLSLQPVVPFNII